MVKRNSGTSKEDICQNQFTAYVVLAVKRKRQAYIKKKQREHEKETRTKKEAEQSEFRTAGYDMWSRMEPQNEKLMAAMQQLSLKERFVVTEYVLKGKPFKEIAQETGLKEKGVASAIIEALKSCEPNGGCKMTFMELLLSAKLGSTSAFEELFARYKNLLRKYSVVNGVFDEDLYQEQCVLFVRCIEIFDVNR